MKKIICVLLCLIFVLSSVMISSAAVVLKYDARDDLNTEESMGNTGWYFLHTETSGYKNYKPMAWFPDATGAPRWAEEYGDGKNVKEYIVEYGTVFRMQARGGDDCSTAIVWEAPYNGNVRLTNTQTKVYKPANTPSEFTTRIVVADAEGNVKEECWEYIFPVNVSGEDAGVDYDLTADIEVGDRIYFEVTCSSSANANVAWQPIVEYNQAAVYSVGGEQKSSIKELSESNTVSLELYAGKNDEDGASAAFTDDAHIYAAVFDNKGRLRNMSNRFFVDTDNFSTGMINLSVTMPSFDANEGETSYEGWTIKTISTTARPGRFYPVNISDMLILK